MPDSKTATTTDTTVLTETFPFGAAVGKEWGWVAFRGVLAFSFGVIAIIWPLATIWTLAVMWGAFAFVDGLGAIATAWRLHKRGVRWWPYTLLAVTGIGAGLVTLLWPGLTAIALLYIIAFWAIFGGISQIVAAIRLRKEIKGEWFLALGGVIGILFGLLIAFRPVPEGIVAVSWMVGYYALLAGCLLFMLAYRLKKHLPIPKLGPHPAPEQTK